MAYQNWLLVKSFSGASPLMAFATIIFLVLFTVVLVRLSEGETLFIKGETVMKIAFSVLIGLLGILVGVNVALSSQLFSATIVLIFIIVVMAYPFFDWCIGNIENFKEVFFPIVFARGLNQKTDGYLFLGTKVFLVGVLAGNIGSYLCYQGCSLMNSNLVK